MTFSTQSTPPVQDPDGLASIPDLRRALTEANAFILAQHEILGEIASDLGLIVAAHTAGDEQGLKRVLDAFVEARVRVIRRDQAEVH